MTVCDDARIRVLNRTHRGIDRATDVLAFPQEHMREGRFLRRSPAADAWLAGKRQEAEGGRRKKTPGPTSASRLPPSASLELGDVVVSRDAVRRQAREYGVCEVEELTRLLVHGVLHLLGWDHERPGERGRMRKLENRLVVEVM